MTYNEGQFRVVKDFLPKPPDWLILGGPADANEAYQAKKMYPNIRIIGVEPVIENIQFQLAHGWPTDGVLLQAGLGAASGQSIIKIPEDKRGASCLENRPGVPHSIKIVTIDFLNRLYGPIDNAVLWLDIEGWEYKALVGASGLFSSGKVSLVNVEILERLTEHTTQIEKFFQDFGFKLAHVWNEQPGLVQDRIYVKG